jgi:hypothetical protein
MPVLALCKVVGSARDYRALAGIRHTGTAQRFPGMDTLRCQIYKRIVFKAGFVDMLQDSQKNY